MDLEEEEEDGPQQPSDKSRCTVCLSLLKRVITFFLSHVGLISLVVGYCIIGALTFESLESQNELQVKRQISGIRYEVAKYLWRLTQNTDVIILEEWHKNATIRLQEFEKELIAAMKKGGWDGSEDENNMQWTFAGGLFYSIVVITTIGFGHLTPRTVPGKIITIIYAILGIPLMLVCLSRIGDFMAKAFRFLYWKICCYMCTRRPKRIMIERGRSHRFSASSRYSAPAGSRIRRSVRRSARISQRSADSAVSDSLNSGNSDPLYRRVHSVEDLFRGGGGGGGGIKMSPTQYSITQTLPLPSNIPSKIGGQVHSTGRSLHTHSAEPIVTGHIQELPIFVNKYVDDDDQLADIDVEMTPRSSRFRPSFEHFVLEEFEELDWDDEDSENRPVPIYLCFLLVVSYIIGGAFLFSEWENWELLDSAYFCFVTLTTIGFGDFVPATSSKYNNREPEVSIAMCSLYLLFGISLLAMTFNLVQEEVISSIKEVAMRLGIIREDEN